MKEDFYKVVIERPRHGSDLPSRKWGWATNSYDPAKHDDQPQRAASGRSRQYGYNARTFTDVLGPLKRFLAGAVGRPWNEVYSEIKKSLDASTVTGQHIIDHVWNFVSRECYEHRGRILGSRFGNAVTGFYVHPRTGILCHEAQESKADRQARYNKPDANTRKLAPLEFHKRIRAVWYYIKVAKCEFRSLFAERQYDADANPKIYGGYFVVSKRQLGSKEIKSLGL